MMDLAPILTGIAVAGLICQATAVPVPFKVEAILPQAEGAPYATMAAQIGKDMLASLIPYRVLKNGGVTYHLGDNTAHTRNASQYVEHIDGSKVTQIDFIEFRVVGSQT